MKIHILTLFALFIAVSVNGQISLPGTPYSRLSDAPPSMFEGKEFKLADVDNAAELAKSKKEQEECEQCGVLYGKELPLVIDIKRDGNAVRVKGGKLWLVTVKSATAKAMQFNFEKYKLPKVASLFIYNQDRSLTLGAFTHINNHPSEHFATQAIPGNVITIEYFEADDNEFKGQLELSGVVHVFRAQSEADDAGRTEDWHDAGLCHLDVACATMGPVTKDIKRSVCRISMPDGSGNWTWCSGTLMNSTATPRPSYVLSAFHCLRGGGYLPSDAWKWIFEFNFEHTGCVNNSPTGSPIGRGSHTGATLKTGGSHLAATSVSDFLLVDLGPVDIETWLTTAAYSGWDRRQFPTNSTRVGIHHPMGDAKKISFDAGMVEEASIQKNNNVVEYVPGGPLNVWKVIWDSGITQGGSSGSGLFEGDKLVGMLSAGSSGGPDGNDCTKHGDDFYSKFGYAWNKRDFPFDAAGTPTLGESLSPSDDFKQTMNSFIPPLPAQGTSDPILLEWATTCRTWNAGIAASPGATILGDFDTEPAGTCIQRQGWRRHGGVVQSACVKTNVSVSNRAVAMDLRGTPGQASMSKAYNFIKGKEYVLSLKVNQTSGQFHILLMKTVPAQPTGGYCDLSTPAAQIFTSGTGQQTIMRLPGISSSPATAFQTWAAAFIPDDNYSNILILNSVNGNYSGKLVIDDILLYEGPTFINNNYNDNMTFEGFLNTFPDELVANTSITVQTSTTSQFVHPWVQSGATAFIRSRSIYLKPGFHAFAGSTVKIQAGPAIWPRQWDSPFGPQESPDYSTLLRVSLEHTDTTGLYSIDVPAVFNYEHEKNIYPSNMLQASLNTLPINEFVPTMIVSPNPTKGKFSGEFITRDPYTIFTVTDMFGKELVKSSAEKNFEVDLSHYSDGIYIVKATVMGKNIATKVVLRK